MVMQGFDRKWQDLPDYILDDGTLVIPAEFLDRQLLSEAVIWSGDEDAGFLSSHRLVTGALCLRQV